MICRMTRRPQELLSKNLYLTYLTRRRMVLHRRPTVREQELPEKMRLRKTQRIRKTLPGKMRLRKTQRIRKTLPEKM